MAKEVIADDAKLGQLAVDLTDISGDIRKRLSKTRETALLKSTAFGNTTDAEDVATSYETLREKAGSAVENLCEVVEGDIDRILRIAFAYQEQDGDNSNNIGST